MKKIWIIFFSHAFFFFVFLFLWYFRNSFQFFFSCFYFLFAYMWVCVWNSNVVVFMRTSMCVSVCMNIWAYLHGLPCIYDFFGISVLPFVGLCMCFCLFVRVLERLEYIICVTYACFNAFSLAMFKSLRVHVYELLNGSSMSLCVDLIMRLYLLLWLRASICLCVCVCVCGLCVCMSVRAFRPSVKYKITLWWGNQLKVCIDFDILRGPILVTPPFSHDTDG